MDRYRDLIEENRDHWDELAVHHPETATYDVDGFLEGESSLRSIEREEVDASGRRLLHLQCHFGLDTLSWVRNEGASHATGVDFSPTAVETARELRDKIGLSRERVRFVESEVSDLPATLDDRFELVVTTYGTIYWLPDLDRWADVVATHLEPGGTFYIADEHPFSAPIGHASVADDIDITHPYFNEEAITEEFDGSYAGRDFGLDHQRSHGFAHPIGEIVTALANAGLRIDFLHEFPWCSFQRLDAMERDAEGRWWLPGLAFDLPFTFSLRATKL